MEVFQFIFARFAELIETLKGAIMFGQVTWYHWLFGLVIAHLLISFVKGFIHINSEGGGYDYGRSTRGRSRKRR